MSRLLRPYFYLTLCALLQSIQYVASTIINAQFEQYKNKRIICDNNENCTINCQQPNSCQYADIECPMDHECNVTCSADASCEHLTINAAYSSLFILRDCHNGNDYTCSGLSIHFPPNLNGDRRGILDVGNNFNSKSNDIEFYAINGWKDIDTTYYFGETQNETIQGIMHCTANYDQQCIFSSLVGECANPNDICNNYTSTASALIPNDPSSNAAEQASDPSTEDILSELRGIFSNLNEMWYIIGSIVLSLCYFLCILLCLIRRSYHIHRAAAKGLRTANDELAAFKSYQGLVSPYNHSLNSPYDQSVPMSSHIGTPIPKSKPPSTASIVTMDIQHDHEVLYDDDKSSIAEHGHHINKAKMAALYRPQWNPQTPLNSLQQRAHHNPPSIMSVSTTTPGQPRHNELGLQSQQIYKLSMQNRLDPIRLPSPSYRSVTTLNSNTVSRNTLNTNVTNQSIQTFMVVQSVNDEDEDEFLEYQQTLSHIYNKSMTSSHNKKMPSAASSSMPLSVNSPSATSSISNLPGVNGRTPQVHNKARDHIAHIPRFDGNNGIDPLPEAHSAEIRNVSPFDGFMPRKDTTDTLSTNIFGSTAHSGSSDSSSSVSNSSSLSSSSSSSSYTSSGNSSSSDDIDDETDAIVEYVGNREPKKNGYALVVGSQPSAQLMSVPNNMMNDKNNSRAHSL